jgi:alkanesulfonate monooxygenase SsuD/methylene tetrahydromethanopterin reductase-like flavin-dependent oxidoreductase (luciferase family)
MLALRALFAGPEASFSGRFFSFDGITVEPLRPGGPPLWVGGRAGPSRRRAGRLGDGWMPIWVSAEKFAAGLADVRRHAAESGRDPDAIAAAVVCPALVGDDARPRLARHLARRYGMTVESHLIDRYCVAGSREECAARVREYAGAGAEHVIVNIGCAAGEELLDQAAQLASLLTVEVS